MTSLKARFFQNSRNVILIFIVINLFVWAFSFREFIFNQRNLIEDARPYYDHFKIYIDQIRRGSYPLWEPMTLNGLPTEFYMRRIGSYNPLILFILVFNTLGIPYTISYLLFLVLYFFLGMLGFYLLAKHVLNSELFGFLAFSLLLFTALGTRIFDSYFLLVFIPMSWFFYFLYIFSKRPQVYSFLGIVFTTMVLLVTYLPFYFLTILWIVVLMFFIFYFKEVGTILKRYLDFAMMHKMLCAFAAVVLLMSTYPAISFFKETKKGEIVLPMRNAAAKVVKEDANVIEVGTKVVKEWAIEEDLAFSQYFSNYKDMKFAILYVPIFVYVLFLCGLWVKVSRRFIFLASTVLFLYVITSPNAFFYDYLYKHMGYFKYFRNIHFFLWMFFLPVFILCLAEQAQVFYNGYKKWESKKAWVAVWVILIHSVLLALIIKSGNAILSSYVGLFLSLGFILFLVFKRNWLEKRLSLTLGLLCLVIFIQPLEVFHYLAKNSPRQTQKYLYDAPYSIYRISTKERMLEDEAVLKGAALKYTQHTEIKNSDIYYGLKNMDFLRSHMKWDSLYTYVGRGEFIAFTKVTPIEDNQVDLEALGRNFVDNNNEVFVSLKAGEVLERPYGELNSSQEKGEVIVQESPELKVVKFDLNELTLKINFPSPKFLVYNQGYHSAWQAYLDGKPLKIYRANIDFRGMWVPAGEHTIYMRFGPAWKYYLNLLYVILFLGVFIALLIISFRTKYADRTS